MLAWVVNSRLHSFLLLLTSFPLCFLTSPFARHVTKISSLQLLLFRPFTNCDARNSFRIRSYENCRVSLLQFPFRNSSLAVEEFFEEEAGEAAGAMAEDSVFFEEIIEDDAVAEFFEGGQIDNHGFGALGAIAPGDLGRNGLPIGNHPIDDAMAHVGLDGAKMLGKRVTGGFTGLRHEISDVDARRLGSGDGGGNFRDEQVWKNAGVERAGTQEDDVRLLDGFDGLGQRLDAARR